MAERPKSSRTEIAACDLQRVGGTRSCRTSAKERQGPVRATANRQADQLPWSACLPRLLDRIT